MLRRRIDVLGCRLIVAGGAVTTDAVVFTGRTGEHLHHTSARGGFGGACRRVALMAVTPHSLWASCDA